MAQFQGISASQENWRSPGLGVGRELLKKLGIWEEIWRRMAPLLEMSWNADGGPLPGVGCLMSSVATQDMQAST